ncbi:MAG TPA: YceI family protein [Rhodothermales bacterium]|nr:YceI family protein [Rhodothermales bacterium]HRR07403.1 YceI family protein [Rhodothermales bacterium]
MMWRYILLILSFWNQPMLGQSLSDYKMGKWAVLQGSIVEIKGKTTLADFRCKASLMIPKKTFYWIKDGNYKVNLVQISIRIRTLDCGNRLFNGVMYEALQANRFPNIEIDVREVEAITSGKNTSGSSRFYAQVSLNGHIKGYQIPVMVQRKASGKFRVKGYQPLKMTAFGVMPPVAIGGMVRTMDDITIGFDLLLDIESQSF